MKKLTLCFIMLITIAIGTSHSQESVREAWVKHYGPDSTNGNTAIAVDRLGNIYVTGLSKGAGTKWDYATIKYNNRGIEKWVARYNGPANGNDEPSAIAIDGRGNVIVTGQSFGSGTHYDYCTVKYNSVGVEQWAARYNGPEDDLDFTTALAIDISGNVYVTGASMGMNSIQDYATVKYNPSGVEQWVCRYPEDVYNPGGYNIDVASDIEVDGSGNVYVTGFSGNDCATLKYRSDAKAIGFQGSELTVLFDAHLWVERAVYAIGTALVVDGTDNIYVTGRTKDRGDPSDIFLIKYNSSGSEQWKKIFNPTRFYDDRARGIAKDRFGNIYVIGMSQGPESAYDYVIIKYNSAGIEQWTARYNSPANLDDIPTSLAVDNIGNVYVTGASTNVDSSSDIITLKYNRSGVQQWIAHYSRAKKSLNFANALALDSSGNIYVTGWSKGEDGISVYTTIKYVQARVSSKKRQ